MAIIQKWRFALMRNLIISNMLSLGLGGDKVLKLLRRLQLNDTPHTRTVLR